MRPEIAPHRGTWRMTAVLPLALLALACGGDDGNGPTEPENGTSEEEQAARAQEQVRGLFTTLEPVVVEAMGLLLQGGGTIEGQQGGTLTVAGSTMTLESFSADGQLVLDGELTLDLLVQPLTLKGDLVASGLEGQEGSVDVKVDITIDPTTDPRTYGGTVTVGEVVYDLAELLAEEEGA